MKFFFLLTLLFSLQSFAALSGKVVREINGKSGSIPELAKADVGLTSALETKFASYTFSGELTSGNAISMIQIPANARVILVGLSSLSDSSCLVGANLGIDGAEGAWGPIFLSGGPLSVPAVTDGLNKWGTVKTMKVFLTQDTNSCTGITLSAILQYIQE